MAATAPVPVVGIASVGLKRVHLLLTGLRATHLQNGRRPPQTSLICTGKETWPCCPLIASCFDLRSCSASCAGVGVLAVMLGIGLIALQKTEAAT